MADEPAFDPAKCNVTPISRIPPCEVMLTNDAVSDAPPAIPDCVEEPLTLPPETPCPDILPTSDAPKNGITYGGTYATNPPKTRYAFVRGSCCDFDLDIDVQVPCPAIGPDTRTITPTWTNTGGSVNYGFTRNLTTCDFNLDIAVDIHCPQMTPDVTAPVSKPFISGGGTILYYFTKAVGCDWTLDIDIDLAGSTCPLLTPALPAAVPVNFVSGTQGTLTYNFERGEACDYSLNIDVNAPCPDIEPQTPTTLYFYTAGSSQAYLTYYFSKGTDCDYTLHIDGMFPPASGSCPDIEPRVVTTLTGGYGATASIDYEFIKTSPCTYTLELSALTVPCPVIGPLTSTHATIDFASGSQGDITYHLTKGTECDYTLSISNVLSPCPDIEPQSPTTITFYTVGLTQAHLTYYFTKGTDCDYTLHIDGVFPPPTGTCPDIYPQTTTTAYSTYGTQGSISYYFTTTGTCDYTLHLDYVAPCQPIGPVAPNYAYLYTAGGTQGFIEYYFTKIGCDYELTINADVPCVDIGPQTPTYEYFYTAPGGQAYLRYYFTKGVDCDYVLSITGSFPEPPIQTIWARITGRSRVGTETRYSFVEVSIDTADQQVDVPNGIQGNITDTYAQDIDLVATDALFQGDMFVSESASDSEPWFIAANQRFLMTRNKLVANCWLFKSSSCLQLKPISPNYAYFYQTAGGQAYLRYYFQKNSDCEYVLDLSGAFPLPEAPVNVIYVEITGRSGNKYSFVQTEPNASGSATAVTPDGITGSTTLGYLQDVGGFADDGLIGKLTWAVRSTTVTDTWIMGPWKKHVFVTVTPGAIHVSSTCDSNTGDITNVVTQDDSTVTYYSHYYIGG